LIQEGLSISYANALTPATKAPGSRPMLRLMISVIIATDDVYICICIYIYIIAMTMP